MTTNTVSAPFRLEVDTASPRNAVRNPSGRLGLFGWYRGAVTSLTALTGSVSVVAEDGYAFLIPSANNGGVAGPPVPVQAGTHTQASFRAICQGALGGGRYCAYLLYFYDGEGSLIGASATEPAVQISAGVAKTYTVNALTPDGAVSARLVISASAEPVGTRDITFARVSMRSGVASDAPMHTYVPANWVDIVGGGTRIETEQGNVLNGVEDELTPGTLVATIRDSSIDPATSGVLVKGRPVRLTTLVGGSWKDVWTGTLATADVDYEDSKDDTVEPIIVVTATDDAQPLGETVCNYALGGGFAKQINHAAAAAGVASWDGTSSANEGTAPIAREDGSKSADWIRRSCNTHGGYAWIDTSNRLTHQLVTYLGVVPVATFSDRFSDLGAIYYSGIGLNYGTRSLTNALMVRRINLDEVDDDGAKDYGPYVASASDTEHGRSTSTIEITEGSPSAVAAAVLPVFATPKIFPTSLRIQVTDSNIGAVLGLTPYAPVRVRRTVKGYDEVVRALRIRHEIEATNDGVTWRTFITPRPLESATPSQVTTPSAGADTGPSDVIPPEPGILGSRYRTADISLAHATWTTVPLNGAVQLDALTWDAANSRYVVPKDGRYVIAAGIRFANAGTAGRYGRVAINGVGPEWIGGSQYASVQQMAWTKVYKLKAGDTVSLMARQDSGAALAVTGSAERNTFLDVTYVGP